MIVRFLFFIFIFSTNFCLSQEQLSPDFRLSKSEDLEKALAFLVDEFYPPEAAADSSRYKSYKRLHKECLIWLKQNPIDNKYKRVYDVFRTAKRQENEKLLFSSGEYLISPSPS